VTIPAFNSSEPARAWAGPLPPGLLPLAALGVLLVVAGFVLTSLAASMGHRGVLIASILGALFILEPPSTGPASSTSTTPRLDDHGRALRCGLGLLRRRALLAQRCSDTGCDRQRGLLAGSTTGNVGGQNQRDAPDQGRREGSRRVAAGAATARSHRKAEAARTGGSVHGRRRGRPGHQARRVGAR
jgi:hypothetical protein